MPATLTLDPENPAVLHARVPLLESRNERGLGTALNELVRVTKDLPRVIAAADEPPPFLRVTFHTPAKKWLSERRFFERTAKYPSLRAATYAYVDHVNPKHWRKDPFRGSGYWSSTQAPAGSLAIVPLALRDRGALPVLAEHLRGADLDHETFHRALIAELLSRHGLIEEMLDLLAVRAVDAAGQHGTEDLAWLARQNGFGAMLNAPGAAVELAERVDRISQRSAYRPLYVANAGKAMFSGDELGRWFGFFRERGLVFEARDLAPSPEREPSPPPSFVAEWEEAASSDDYD